MSDRRNRYLQGVTELRKESPTLDLQPASGDSQQLYDEIKNFDWMNFVSTAPDKPFKPSFHHVAGEKIDDEERKQRFIGGLSSACFSCSMCNLGLDMAQAHNTKRDPHLFSNKLISNIMVVGFRPEWIDLEKNDPTMRLSKKYEWLDIDKMYVTNLIKCGGDLAAGADNVSACINYLKMEVSILKPKLMLVTNSVFYNLGSDWNKEPSDSLGDTHIMNITFGGGVRVLVVNIDEIKQDKIKALKKLTLKLLT